MACQPTTAPAALALSRALERLDRLIAGAVPAAARHFDGGDLFRGLHIDAAEVQRLLARPPGEPLLWDAAAPGEAADGPWPLDMLRHRLGLSAFDLDLVVLALAPEIDLRYERLFAYLQDDVTRRRPQVDLALNLLCHSAEERIARRAHLLPGALLLCRHVVTLHGDGLAATLQLDAQVLHWFLGHDTVHQDLAAGCRLCTGGPGLDELELPAATRRSLQALDLGAQHTRRLQFVGPRGVGKRSTAAALAQSLGSGLVDVDLARLWAGSADAARLVALVLREARARGAVLHVRGLDGAGEVPPPAALESWWDALEDHPGLVVVAGVAPAPGAGPRFVDVRFDAPDLPARRSVWRTRLADAGLPMADTEIDALAGRYRLTAGQIGRAVASAACHASAHDANDAACAAHLFPAARAQAGHALARLADRVETRRRWADLVLPAETMAQLREIGDHVAHRDRVYGEWGLGRALSPGRGVNALFYGPPGTGKTMAAEVIAAETGLDLVRIDLSRIVDKYIGETEKKLDAVFRAAQDASAVLLFDEADALFGKRSEVKDAHDRYANIEVGYLLQKLEQHDGVVLLATNLRQHLDEAFVRRLHVIVEFPFPDEAQRLRLWTGALPPEAPLAADVDLRRLARDVRLAGGHVRNVIVSAAFFAARDGSAIGMAHLLQAVCKEHRKLNRAWAGAAGAPLRLAETAAA